MANAAASRLILAPFCEETVRRAAHSALEEVGGKVSVAFVFASIDYEPHLDDFLELLTVHGHIPLLVGCSGSGVIGTKQEAEQQTGFSLLFLHLPATKITPVVVNTAAVESVGSSEGWHRETGVKGASAWISLIDPFGFPVEEWLEQWNRAYPGVPIIGGLSSSRKEGEEGEQVFVFHNRDLLEPGEGLAIAFEGGVEISPVVAQGCRPIGEPLTITAANGNTLLRLGGLPAYSALAEAFEGLADEEKARAQGNLFAGLVCSEYLDDFRQGDFLIRPILGGDADSGAIAVGAYPRVGQSLQWQLRDQVSADRDLRRRLRRTAMRIQPIASLVFSCTGRGKELFEMENHDVNAIASQFGPVPAAGFFCNGEIGPVHGQSFVHGYSASIAFFGDKTTLAEG